jgi:hypothetical protein
VLEANYPLIEGRSEIVGFTIKGVAHLCETQKISPSAPWRLADFLDAVVKSSSSGRVLVQHLVRPLVQDKIQDIERLAA